MIASNDTGKDAVMRKTVAPVILCVLLSAIISAPAFATDDIKVGDKVRTELEVGRAGTSKTVPLPAGEWQVVRFNDGGKTSASTVVRERPMVDVTLVQRDGSNLVMLMRIVANKDPISGARWNNDPCGRNDLVHRNAYDSKLFEVKCLTVNHIPGFLASTAADNFSEVREWAGKESVSIPATALRGDFTQFGSNRFLRVSVWINPALRKLDARERKWAANPFHRDALANDPERKRYVDEFIAWSEAYMKRITLTMRGRLDSAEPGVAPVPVFR